MNVFLCVYVRSRTALDQKFLCFQKTERPKSHLGLFWFFLKNQRHPRTVLAVRKHFASIDAPLGVFGIVRHFLNKFLKEKYTFDEVVIVFLPLWDCVNLWKVFKFLLFGKVVKVFYSWIKHKKKQDGNVPSRRHILGSKIFKEQLLEKFGKKFFFKKNFWFFSKKSIF